MAVEKASRILNGKRHILLRRNNMSFWNVSDIVNASLCLHNLCILENDEFDMNWAK